MRGVWNAVKRIRLKNLISQEMLQPNQAIEFQKFICSSKNSGTAAVICGQFIRTMPAKREPLLNLHLMFSIRCIILEIFVPEVIYKPHRPILLPYPTLKDWAQTERPSCGQQLAESRQAQKKDLKDSRKTGAIRPQISTESSGCKIFGN